MSANTVLGALGAGVITVSAIYYLVDILRGGTRPQRTSWGVWAVIGILGFGTADAGGAGPGAWASGVDAIACVVTFIVSLNGRYGKPGASRLDPVLGVVALAGVVLWRWGPLSITEAALCAIACDFAALWPTLREAWRQPELESLASWSADLFGHVFCLFAMAEISVAAMAFPVYMVVATLAVTGVLIVRRNDRPDMAGRDCIPDVAPKDDSEALPTPSAGSAPGSDPLYGKAEDSSSSERASVTSGGAT